jgi:hypothetical protein
MPIRGISFALWLEASRPYLDAALSTQALPLPPATQSQNLFDPLGNCKNTQTAKPVKTGENR